ncbi:MAG: ABC transporter substrate-binding protein [Thaumarchaeota archaeon]|nr:ABC transporter substrate-binding protein [Nitrososphaerota archaeon]
MRRTLALLLVFAAALAFFSTVAASEQGVVVVDSFGRVVEVPEKPMRIVSLAPSITETLFAMGLGDRVVGVTNLCNYPPQVPELVKEGKIDVVGGFTNPSLEKIVALDPDLVLAHNLLSPDFVKKLEDLGIPVVVAIRTPESIDEVYRVIMLIGRASWEEERATELVTSLILKIQFWKEQMGNVEKVDAAYILSYGPIWVAGSGTYIDELIELAGGRNAFSDKSWWISISEEELVAKDPGILIVSNEHVYEALKDLKEKGLIHGEIKLVSPDPVERPGPRIVNALEEFVKAIHPEIWSKVIEVLDLNAPSEAEPDQPMRITVEVKNPGLINGTKLIELKFGEEVYSKQVHLRPGESKTVEFEVSAGKPGAYLIEVGDRYAVCYVRESRESEVKALQESLLNELASIKSAESSLINKLDSLASTFNSQVASMNNTAIELRNLVIILSVISVTSLILSIGVAVVVVKSRRKGNV